MSHVSVSLSTPTKRHLQESPAQCPRLSPAIKRRRQGQALTPSGGVSGVRASSPRKSLFEQVVPVDTDAADALLCSIMPSLQHEDQDAHLLSEADAKHILELAVQRFEAEARRLYDERLSRLVHEQLSNFSKFNEDFIQRKLKRSDFSYMS